MKKAAKKPRGKAASASVKPKTLAKMIAVMNAHKSGKPIEYRPLKSDEEWKPCPVPGWNWSLFDYQVMPEPIRAYREFCYRWQCDYCSREHRQAECLPGHEYRCHDCGQSKLIGSIQYDNGTIAYPPKPKSFC